MSEVLPKAPALHPVDSREIFKRPQQFFYCQRPTLATILEKLPELSNYFEIRQNLAQTRSHDTLAALNKTRNDNNVKNDAIEQEHVKRMRDSVQKSVLSLNSIINLIAEIEAQQKEKIREIQGDIKNVCQRKDASFQNKILLYLKYQENIKIVNYYTKYVKSHIVYVNNLVEIANIVQREHPHAEYIIHTDEIIKSIKKKPDVSYFEDRKKILARKIQNVSSEEKSLKINNMLDAVFISCEEHYNESFDFIEDDGLIDFEKAIDSTSNIYHGGLLNAIKRLIDNPKNSGEIIIELCQVFIEKFHATHQNALRYLFIIFTRYVFSRVYTMFAHQKIIVSDLLFINKLNKLRNCSPNDFPPSLKFLPSELHNVKISDFPDDHFYSSCVADILFLQFETCPVDFCYAAYKALNHLQKVAASFLHQSSEKDQEDCQLSLDELLDVTTIMLALASPVELRRMVTTFAPFVCGLRLSSQLEFAFMSLQSACDHVFSFRIKK
ncbi:hypothetical protein TRFO_31509 [Tritrichomonas foetus]|uniref:Uncharacterized protein n=1 Tax=Tritrichomonas foetus TaxID=1144522 RepID=A0A1J4JS96_9EUKA|nr:hypothetical protein TRFO_31509 [Tritrichomonas foetus]|eukprot:OHT01634.1 hypothetical protein TRFO_31509 [Tritrichomonas foetus]